MGQPMGHDVHRSQNYTRKSLQRNSCACISSRLFEWNVILIGVRKYGGRYQVHSFNPKKH